LRLVALVFDNRTKEVAVSVRRLALTVAAMGLIAVALAALTPGFSAMTSGLRSAQRTADTTGPDVLVLSAAGLLAWAVWAWGMLGLALTAATALPGMTGRAASLAVHVVLPAGARRSAALALGLGLGVAGPLLGTASVLMAPPASAAVPAADLPSVPDWPVSIASADTAPVPDWPAPASPQQDGAVPDRPTGDRTAGSHVVVRGDCLWHIAADRLREQQGRAPTDGEVALAVRAWWTANAAVIGPDPDLLLPGQVLRPPSPP
jgi:hypothetical protein